jgi:ComF family protein
MHALFRLSRCVLCQARPSSALGCCESCAHSLFRPSLKDNELALGDYDGSLRKAVQALKYRQVTRLAELFGCRVAAEVNRAGWQPALITAVPLHLSRRLRRGYNQAEMIARAAARELGLPYRAVLSRTRATKKQILLSPGARADNVADAFKAKALEGERVLLIDDVTTSGATLTECSLALLAAGASRVYLAVVARADSARA